MMTNPIGVTVQSKDFTECGQGTTASTPHYPNLTVTMGAEGHLQWNVHLPKEGMWHLHALMTAAAARPCTLFINGIAQAKPILAETTGSWLSDKLAWFTYGPYPFKQGDNTFRIEFRSCMPHLKEFRFSQGATEATDPVQSLAGQGHNLAGTGNLI